MLKEQSPSKDELASEPARVVLPTETQLVAARPVRARLASIDIVRGLVILLMALDHVRDFVGQNAFSPTDLSRTTSALFFTRWVTHFCAPAFVFLAGVSAQRLSVRLSPGALRRFLLTRGVWLIVLELTLVNFAWNFNVGYRSGLILQVIWAIGCSLCALAALSFLPSRAILFVGATLVAGHNLLDPIAPETFGTWAPLWNVLHVAGPVPFGLVVYPLLPWIGTIALGFAAGRLFDLPAERRLRWLVRLGVGATLAFVSLRALNVYGDPEPWTPQASTWFTLLSFLNVSKYPPSLAYLLMTLGPIMLLLALAELLSARSAPAARTGELLATVGRVPLFAYVIHLVLVHSLAGLIGASTGHGSSMLTQIFVSYPKSWGYGLPIVYAAWALVLALLYPACAWFAGIKRRHQSWWIAYL